MNHIRERKNDFVLDGRMTKFPEYGIYGTLGYVYRQGVSYQEQWWFIQWKYLLRKEEFLTSKYKRMEGYDDFKAFLSVFCLIIDKGKGELSESLEDEVDLLRRKK